MLRWSRLLVRTVMAVLATLAILAGFLAWRVAQGPVSLDFLIPYIREALTVPQLGINAEMDDVVLAWSERDESLRLRLFNVRYQIKGERVGLEVPNIDMGLSGRALLRGVIAPRYLHISGVQARLVRDASGKFLIGSAEEDGVAAAPEAQDGAVMEDPSAVDGSEARLFAAAFELLSRERSLDDPFGQLETVSILTERLLLEDWRLDQRWVVPGAQIVLQRGEGHVFATASGSLDWRGRQVELKVDADYAASDRSARVVLGFGNVEPSDFADVVPELAPLSYVRAPLSGNLMLTVTEDGRQLDLGFDLAAAAGSIEAPELFAAPLQMESAAFRGLIAAADGVLVLEQAEIAMADGFRLAFAGNVIEEARNRFSLDVQGEFSGLATDALALYWPQGMAQNARDWVVTNIRKGEVQSGRFAAKLTPAMLDGAEPMPREALKLDFTFGGLEVDYLTPMTKLSEAKGKASMDAEDFELHVESAKAGPLQLGSGVVKILSLQAEKQQTDISAQVRGTGRDVLALLDQKPLGFPSRLGIKPASVGGDATVRFRLRFPLVASLKVEDVGVTAEADLKNLSMAGLLNRYELSQGEMKLKVDTNGLDGSGNAVLNGVPLQLAWRQEFSARAAVQARYRLKGSIDEAQRAALGYPLAPYIDGPAQASLEIEERRGGETVVNGEFDFTETVFDIADAHFTKPAGQAAQGRVQIRTKTGQPVRFDLIEVKGPQLSLKAKAVLPQGGGWSADIAEFRHDDNDVTGKISFNAAGDGQIELRGRRYDLRPFIKDAMGSDVAAPAAQPDGAPATKPRLALDLRFDEAVVETDLEMRNLSVSVRREPTRLETVSLTGGFAKTGGMTLTIGPQLDGRKLELRSDNAGAVLHLLGITDMQGGRMEVLGRYDDAQPGQPLSGRMVMLDVRAVKAPFLARLFGAGSFTGLGALLSGEGILFEKGDVPFEQKDGVLTIKPSRLRGPQIGITFEGTVNNHTDHISVNGTAVPAFVLNTILGKIPVLGDIFVGDGIIGVNFAVSGPRNDPQFTVNPLSAIAPGFLRRIFQAPETAATPESGSDGVERPAIPEERVSP